MVRDKGRSDFGREKNSCEDTCKGSEICYHMSDFATADTVGTSPGVKYRFSASSCDLACEGNVPGDCQVNRGRVLSLGCFGCLLGMCSLLFVVVLARTWHSRA